MACLNAGAVYDYLFGVLSTHHDRPVSRFALQPQPCVGIFAKADEDGNFKRDTAHVGHPRLELRQHGRDLQ